MQIQAIHCVFPKIQRYLALTDLDAASRVSLDWYCLTHQQDSALLKGKRDREIKSLLSSEVIKLRCSLIRIDPVIAQLLIDKTVRNGNAHQIRVIHATLNSLSPRLRLWLTEQTDRLDQVDLQSEFKVLLPKIESIMCGRSGPDVSELVAKTIANQLNRALTNAIEAYQNFGSVIDHRAWFTKPIADVLWEISRELDPATLKLGLGKWNETYVPDTIELLGKQLVENRRSIARSMIKAIRDGMDEKKRSRYRFVLGMLNSWLEEEIGSLAVSGK